MPNERVRDRYPNRLREFRERALLTRVEFAKKSELLAAGDPHTHRFISHETLRNLEGGFTRPRLSTARTIAAVLGVPAELLFPAGFDSGNRH